MGMYGALVAVEDASATTAFAVGERIMEASLEADGVRVLAVDKGWQWLGRTFSKALPGALVPFGDASSLFVGDLDSVIVAELDAMDDIDEAFEIAGRHGASVMAVLEATSYGPAFWLTPDAVAEFVAALNMVEPSVLRAAAEEVAAADPAPVSSGPELTDEILALVTVTATFMAAAATRGDGVAFGVT